MKKIMAVALIAAALITMVIVPVGAELTSGEQGIYDRTPIKCPECGQQLNNTDGDGNKTPIVWGDIKDTINYDTADNYTHYCDNCQTDVTLHFWTCKYSSCRICLPTNPGDVCPNCHAYQVIPEDIQEMIYGMSDAENSYYAGTVLGYEKGKAAGTDGGYEAGYNAGYEAGRSEGAGSSGESGGSEGSDAYEAGLAAGRQQVLDELEATATTNKYYQAGVTAGYNNGYSVGYTAGEKAGYNKGYSAGYSAGYAANQAALKKAQQEAEAAKARYDSAYQEGMQAEVSKNFISLVGEIAAAPFHAVQNMFNFEIFGVNVASILLAIFTAIIVVAVIALVLKFVL